MPLPATELYQKLAGEGRLRLDDELLRLPIRAIDKRLHVLLHDRKVRSLHFLGLAKRREARPSCAPRADPATPESSHPSR